VSQPLAYRCQGTRADGSRCTNRSNTWARAGHFCGLHVCRPKARDTMPTADLQAVADLLEQVSRLLREAARA
jgi:hypothetical protein